jgi:tetratricopeptide (TPR) repeat protein
MSKWFPLIVILIIVVAGCAVRSDYYQGQRSLESGNYDAAISLFQYSLKTSPSDPKILTGLGYAYYKKNDIPNAIQYLESAKSADPLYGKAYLYLGRIYEEQENLQKAIKEYNDYYQLEPLTPLGRKLKARIGILMRNQIAKEIKEAIEKEKELSVEDIPENTIAIYYFTNHTGNKEFDPLAKGFTDMLITDLSQSKSIRVLERTRLQVLMDEMQLSSTAAFDQSTASRFGHLLGARRIISGGFASPELNILRIDSIATDVATGVNKAQADVSGEQNNFFTLEKELVFNILDSMNISITQEERDAIQKTPTESFLAFLAYSRGLDYEDKGMYREASQEFKKAVQIDPNFSHAVEKSQEVQVLIDTPMTGSTSELAQIESVAVKETPKTEPTAGTGPGSALSSIDRLEPITNNVGDGFIPETGTQTEGQSTPSQVQTATILNLTIEW